MTDVIEIEGPAPAVLRAGRNDHGGRRARPGRSRVRCLAAYLTVLIGDAAHSFHRRDIAAGT